MAKSTKSKTIKKSKPGAEKESDASFKKKKKKKVVEKHNTDAQNESDVSFKKKKKMKKKVEKHNTGAQNESDVSFKKKKKKKVEKFNTGNTRSVEQIGDAVNAGSMLKTLKKKKQKDDDHFSCVTGGVTEIKQDKSKSSKGKGKRSKDNQNNSETKLSKEKTEVPIEGGSQGSSIDFVLPNEINQSTKRKREMDNPTTSRKNKFPKKMIQTVLDFDSSSTNSSTDDRESNKTKKRKDVIKKRSKSNSGSMMKKRPKSDASLNDTNNSESSEKKKITKKKKGNKVAKITSTNSERNKYNVENNKVNGKDDDRSDHNSLNEGTPRTLRKSSAKKIKRMNSVSDLKKKTLKEMHHAFSIQHNELANHIKDQLYPDGTESSSLAVVSAMLKECILGERWEDANRLLCAMCLYMDRSPVLIGLFKFGVHVLQNHPRGNTKSTEDFYLLMRKIDFINSYQEKLEHALFVLQQDRMEDALSILTDVWSTSRSGYIFNPKKEGIWKKLCHAYAGMLEYCQWYESAKSRGDDDHREEASSKEGDVIRKRALKLLNQFKGEPGVWDIFITKQVEMLEAEGSTKEAMKVLIDYVNVNPRNPNAHVYLYQFLKRHSPTAENLKPVLKKLASLLPAEDYTLEYIDLLEKNDCADVAEVLPLLFNMADYCSCRYNTVLWETLVEYVIPIAECQEPTIIALLKECCIHRKKWWTSYHFDKRDVSDLVKRDPKLAFHKAILAAILLGSYFPFVQKTRDALLKMKSDLTNELDNEISLWCKPFL